MGVNARTVLAVDAGDTKTDVLLVDSGGTVLGAARGPGACHQTIGARAALDRIEALAGRAARQAGRPATPPFADHTAAFLSGVDFPREREALHEAIRGRGWSTSSVVDNDTFALLRSGTTDNVGVSVVCGTGINCVGVAPDGRVHRFLALGRLSGDWGGGQDLGSEVLWLAARAADGRGEPTALLDAVLAHFSRSSMADLLEAMHFGEIPANAVDRLAPLLTRVAGTGDEVAAEVLHRLAGELATLATITLRRLDFLERPATVVLGGGVIAGAGPGMVREVALRCAAVAPLSTVLVPEILPVAGAALLGLEEIGAHTAETRLRAEFAARWVPSAG
ncbi:putative N-acetylglucosamine kinase [Saccharomonospora marina XMU15]|uniref:Putative N-acetylglucosamine kinase n=1 Tax=Saccharomonospora marina XMU15 TaxID=882083 RepID=H5X7T1_9PSEU|nr:BadF/BadG/BcrA/BcrD ATPase family protein [Saccharomonospora marina]EHR52431.1 putative N-acetylglucosamine kinase [Saccharomonospora marina XMU15]